MDKIKVLIIGSGGREHAIAWKIKQSPMVREIFIAPGNAGTAKIGNNIDIKAEDLKGLLNFALKEKIDLTIVGPETPLALGIVDLFEKHKLKIFGPSKKAAKIESSKIFAKYFMKKFKIPTANFKVFSNYFEAENYLKKSSFPIVLKADGLAGGKGVIVSTDFEEAKKGLKELMIDKKFGSAGKRVVIEEYLSGQEISAICLTDGFFVLPLLPAQDHKAIFDNDKGPNTGGMGAYAPVPFVNKKLYNEIVEKILKPAVLGMKKIGRLYKGVLYAGLMLTQEGPEVLEFNCRFGDPETQPQMMLLKSDLVDLMFGCIEGNLEKKKLSWHKGYSVCVVLASKGYPGDYEKGFEIKGLERKLPPNLQIFHAGTKLEGDKVLTQGGRVLGVTSLASSLKLAIKKAYFAIKKIDFENKYFRKDIGAKGLNFQNQK